MVMSHFDVLRRIIDDHEGAIVKTIGDAVMAVFRRPLLALQAMLSAQRELASPAGGYRPFELRVGINSGPCVAVNLNERLDYFGSTVNMAARLEALSTGGEVIVSDTVRRDPEVATWLAANREALVIQQVESSLKGFEGERFDLHLIAYK
jgi:class 3 adenylate cyclase